MKNFRIIVYLMFVMNSSFAQSANHGIDFKALFDNTVSGINQANTNTSIKSMILAAEESNSNRFIEIGYFINANNIMFLKSNDERYLNNNFEITDALVKNTVFKNGFPRWFAKIKSKTDTNIQMNNKEFMLYEGYLFRYLAEFLFIVKKHNISNKGHLLTADFINLNFIKWKEESFSIYNDNSFFINSRIHIGALWATTALYLSELTLKNDYYISFYNEFNDLLKTNIKVQKGSITKPSCYVWHSTYDNLTKSKIALERKISKKDRSPIIQDVTHGNHVIQFIIASYKLKRGNWSKKNLLLFTNTLKFNIWNGADHSFTDNVDGSSFDVKSKLRGSGWKQTDGWMKLMEYDHDLYSIYLSFYKIASNKVKINKSYLNLQFYALMYNISQQ
ncbi:hypothetical protein [Flavobacterium sp.]|uniref:hypothetical protein n=1 Tax=Flavobacterium sp. TaxID=239 RepID=UPI0026067F47|nr:hypothetical protein [Flavobacterium sp.]MDG2433288.1 hypothetical protein [Flavobacterium sp.]